MADVAISTLFLAKDRITRTLNRVGNKTQTTAERMSKALDRVSASGTKMRGIMGGVAGGIVLSRGIFAMGQGVRSVVDNVIELDGAITNAAAKFPERIQRGTAEFERLDAAARRVGATTEFTAAQAGGGLEFLAMAGFDAGQAMAVLPQMVDLATASNMDFARASDIATDALGAFNLMTKDSGQLSTNLSRVNDVFARTTTKSNVTLEHLFETMKMAGPVMTTAGQSVETFSAIAGIMGNSGIKASTAGTAMRSMATRLASPMAEGAKELRKLGINAADSSGNMRDMVDILDDYAKATTGMGEAQKVASIKAIFGQYAISGVSAVMTTGIDKLRDFRGELENSTGASATMAAEMRRGIGKRFAVLKSTAIDLGMKVAEAFQDKFPNAIDSAISALRDFDIEPVVNGVKSFIDLAISAKNLFVEYRPLIGAVAGAFLALSVAVKVTAAALGVLNLVVALNPFMLLVMAIGAAIFLLWYYHDEISAWGEGVIESVVDFTDSVNEHIMGMAIGAYNGFARMWNWIMDIAIQSTKAMISLAERAAAAFGMKLDGGIGKLASEIAIGGMKFEEREAPQAGDARKARQKAWGLPQTTKEQEREMRAQLVDDPRLSTKNKTDVDVNIILKSVAEAAGQQIQTMAATAETSDSGASVTVNKKRAGRN